MNVRLLAATAAGEYAALSGELLGSLYPAGAPRFRQETLPEQQHFVCAVFVLQNGQPLARAVLFHNPGISIDGRPTALVGHLEIVNDRGVFETLLETVGAEARRRGMTTLVGPINGSTWEDYRCLVSGSPEPFFTELQQLPYYAQLWEGAGCQPLESYYSAIADLPKPEVHEQPWTTSLAGTGVELRPIRTEAMDSELRALYPTVSKAFAHSPLYTPLSEAEFVAKLLPLKCWLDPDCTLIATAEGGPVGFFLCLPDHFGRPDETIIVKTIARRPGFDQAGLIPSMGKAVYDIAARKGYRRVIHAFIHASNRSRFRSTQFGGKAFRRYALYQKSLQRGAS